MDILKLLNRNSNVCMLEKEVGSFIWTESEL